MRCDDLTRVYKNIKKDISPTRMRYIVKYIKKKKENIIKIKKESTNQDRKYLLLKSKMLFDRGANESVKNINKKQTFVRETEWRSS